MNITKKLPTVLLVGRTNVGKSTLFNRLAEEKKSIVFSRSGVTRDALNTTVNWDNKQFSLVDTGGMTFRKNTDEIQRKVQEKVINLMQQGDLLLFICDGKDGLTYEDKEIARIVHRAQKPTLLVINKSDNINRMYENEHEFYQLGFKERLNISSIHGTGIADLLDYVTAQLPEPKTIVEEKCRYNIVIIGKPNVGKSSLMNILTKQERSIVSDIAGTTREAIAETIKYHGESIKLIDTAGVRRKRRVNDDLEELMVKSSLESIRTTDTVILMIDGSQASISDQELKLLFYAYEEKKNILVIINKTDIMDEAIRYSIDVNLAEYDFIFRKIPILYTSCMTKKNIGKIFKELDTIHQRAQQPLNSSEVNEHVQEALKRKPLYHNRQPLRLFKIRNVPGKVPSFVLHVNHPEWFDDAALGCIENILRDKYDFKGCPLQLMTRKV